MPTLDASLQTALEKLEWPVEAAVDLAAVAHIVMFEKGATIFRAGESADLLYLLLSGEVKSYYTNEHGQRLLVSISTTGQLIGCAAIQSSSGENDGQIFTSEALCRCRVAIISKTQATRVARAMGSQQIVDIMQRATEQWTRFSCRLLTFLTMDVRSRLAYVIGEIADSFGISDQRGKLIRLKLSHEDFGELVGASRPMVSKHLKEFSTAGIFFKQDGHYILSREEALRELVEGVEWPAVLARRETDCESVASSRTPTSAAGSGARLGTLANRTKPAPRRTKAEATQCKVA